MTYLSVRRRLDSSLLVCLYIQYCVYIVGLHLKHEAESLKHANYVVEAKLCKTGQALYPYWYASKNKTNRRFSVHTRVPVCVCDIDCHTCWSQSVDACAQEARSSMPTPNQYAFFKPHFCLKKIGRLTNTSTVSTRSPNEK